MENFNPLASPNAGAPALKYEYVNTVTPSPGEVKGLIYVYILIFLIIIIYLYIYYYLYIFNFIYIIKK